MMFLLLLHILLGILLAQVILRLPNLNARLISEQSSHPMVQHQLLTSRSSRIKCYIKLSKVNQAMVIAKDFNDKWSSGEENVLLKMMKVECGSVNNLMPFNASQGIFIA
jgi:hypothetical protein